MLALALLFGVIGYPLWRAINFGYIFNIHGQFAISQTRDAVGVAYALFLLGLPVNLINKILWRISATPDRKLLFSSRCRPKPPGNRGDDIFPRRPRGAGIGIFRISPAQQYDLHVMAICFP